MRHSKSRFAAGCLLLLLAAAPLFAQQAPPPMTGAERRTVVDSVLATLRAEYIFPERIAAAAPELRRLAGRGAYDTLASPIAFAEAVTADLQRIVGDRHLLVQWWPTIVPDRRMQEAPDPEGDALARAAGRAANFGLERAERLPGNVGYIEMRDFPWLPADADAAIAAAMGVVANTDALILDLRRCRGGDPRTAARWLSYFYAAEPMVLKFIEWRADHRIDTLRVDATLAGPRYGPGRPVYVLVSGSTFSGGESIAYDLQARKRAIVVGERTMGGAHPNPMRRATAHFSVNVASGHVVHPVTGGDWEGAGVTPDVASSPSDALRVAQLAAIDTLMAAPGLAPPRRQQLQRLRESLQAPPPKS